MNLEMLENKVQSMLDGEKKRREVGIEFINKVAEIMEDVATDIWGTGSNCEFENIVWLTRINKEGKKQETTIYFRWEEHNTQNGCEEVGFYDSIEYPVWGTDVTEQKGADFWYAVQVIKDWIPQVIEMIDKREKSRQTLLDLLK